MKKIITCLTLSLFFINSYAQLPLKPEDISPILIGEKVPDVTVKDIKGQQVQTGNLFTKPTILVFYRGGWCPFCNKQLSALGQEQEAIEKSGYQVIAVSPDDASHLSASADKNKLSYTLLSDGSGIFAKAMGLAFQAPDKYKDLLSKSSGNSNEGFLPVPAVYIVNQKSEVEFMYINPDYKKRLTSELLLAVLKSLPHS